MAMPANAATAISPILRTGSFIDSCSSDDANTSSEGYRRVSLLTEDNMSRSADVN